MGLVLGAQDLSEGLPRGRVRRFRQRGKAHSLTCGTYADVGIIGVLLIEIRGSIVMARLRRHGHVVAVASGPARKGKNAATKGESLFSDRRHPSRERVYNSPMPAEKRRRGHFWIAPEKFHYADLRVMPMWSWNPLLGKGFRAGEVGIIR